MSHNNTDVVDQVKQANKIESVINETHALTGRGRYLRARAHDSLIVDTHNQAYHWNSSSEHGDVINWVMKRNGLDFKDAVMFLCRRSGLPDPEWGKESAVDRQAARMREDALTVGAMVFARWLAKDVNAMAYARGRGWTDETVTNAMIGYSGSGTFDERNELMEELRLRQLDMDAPVCVALLGYKGDVRSWMTRHDLTLNDDWVRNGYVPGMSGRKMLVYPHQQMGRIRYLSGRGIEEKKHWNLPEILVGKRQPYWNREYSGQAERVVVVEGQADAISLGQWNVAAVALAGTSLEDWIVSVLHEHDMVYVGMDADQAGQKTRGEIANRMGAMTRLVAWGVVPPAGDETRDGRPENSEQGGENAPLEGTKDANDLLKRWAAAGIAENEQNRRLLLLLDEAPTYVEYMAEKSGMVEGAKREAAQRDVFGLVAKMGKVELAQYRDRLARLMGIKKSEFDGVLKAVSSNGSAAAGKRDAEIVETLGGMFGAVDGSKGWLVEYVYEPEKNEARLAWRDPDGKTGVSDSLLIGGIKYVPKPPNGFIRDGAVLFASDLGELKSTRELVALAEMFIKRHYLLDGRFLPRIIAYYVMLTWVYDAFNALPYLRAMGEPGAGKSELMRRVGAICYRLITASGANTAACFFRTTEIYKGTVFIDEADLSDGGDMTNDLVKFINLGAMKGNPISRLEESFDSTGKKVWEPGTFSTFGPKLIAMRKDFADKAVGSRAITIPLIEKDPIELKAAGIQLQMNEDFKRQAIIMRNLLLRWRLAHWEVEIEISEELMDLEISARLNQVTMPLLALAKDDPELLSEIRKFLRTYYAEMVLDRSMTIAARVVEAMWEIWKSPVDHAKHIKKDSTGRMYMFSSAIFKKTNAIIDEMNDGGDEENEEDKKKRRRKELTGQGIVRILRDHLHIEVGKHWHEGSPVYWDEMKMKIYGKQYGVLSSKELNEGVPAPPEPAEPKIEPKQAKLEVY